MAQINNVQLNRHDIKSIAESLGIRFELTNDPMSDQDADVVTLYDPGTKFAWGANEEILDAIVYLNASSMNLVWSNGNNSKAAIRKWFEGEATQCCICFDELGAHDGAKCPRCSCTSCKVCLMTSRLHHENLACISRGQFQMTKNKCVECRTEGPMDLRMGVIVLKEDLSDCEFSKEQLDAIALMKQCVPQFEERRASYLDCCRRSAKDNVNRFARGMHVRLRELKKRDWNGQEAVITGKRTIRDGVIRWPVRLNKSGAEAMLKPCNLQKIIKGGAPKKQHKSKKRKRRRR